MTILYFECKKCNRKFKFNVGKIKINENQTINFQKETSCPYCKESSKELLELTKENTDILRDINDEQEKEEAIKNYRPGKLVNYPAIFGRETIVRLIFKSNEYLISDKYCVIPNCNCTNVILDFHLHDEKNGPARWSFSFTYDYLNGNIFETEGIDETHSKEIIELLEKNMQISFRQRHHELKDFLREMINKKIQKYTVKRNLKNIQPVKIGRNEPCPCGSGKKYKKCCLEKFAKTQNSS